MSHFCAAPRGTRCDECNQRAGLQCSCFRTILRLAKSAHIVSSATTTPSTMPGCMFSRRGIVVQARSGAGTVSRAGKGEEEPELLCGHADSTDGMPHCPQPTIPLGLDFPLTGMLGGESSRSTPCWLCCSLRLAPARGSPALPPTLALALPPSSPASHTAGVVCGGSHWDSAAGTAAEALKGPAIMIHCVPREGREGGQQARMCSGARCGRKGEQGGQWALEALRPQQALSALRPGSTGQQQQQQWQEAAMAAAWRGASRMRNTGRAPTSSRNSNPHLTPNLKPKTSTQACLCSRILHHLQ